MRLRIVVGAAGALLGLFGALRLVTQIPLGHLVVLAIWLIGAVVIHDGILSPLVVGIGWAISRSVPARARGSLQFALIVAGLVTVVAIPLIYRQGSQPASKAILRQQYGGNLTVLLGIIVAITLVLYAVQVARRGAGRQPVTPPADVGR